jgi:1-deoxy-D-xylulose-5-phosphate synthase
VLRFAATHTGLVTLEENAVAGGAGSAVLELLANCGHSLPSLTLGIPDDFIEHGSREDCLALAKLDPASLETAVRRWWEQLPASKMRASGT